MASGSDVMAMISSPRGVEELAPSFPPDDYDELSPASPISDAETHDSDQTHSTEASQSRPPDASAAYGPRDDGEIILVLETLVRYRRDFLDSPTLGDHPDQAFWESCNNMIDGRCGRKLFPDWTRLKRWVLKKRYYVGGRRHHHQQQQQPPPQHQGREEPAVWARKSVLIRRWTKCARFRDAKVETANWLKATTEALGALRVERLTGAREVTTDNLDAQKIEVIWEELAREVGELETDLAAGMYLSPSHTDSSS